jgi:hypothetical protein
MFGIFFGAKTEFIGREDHEFNRDADFLMSSTIIDRKGGGDGWRDELEKDAVEEKAS